MCHFGYVTKGKCVTLGMSKISHLGYVYCIWKFEFLCNNSPYIKLFAYWLSNDARPMLEFCLNLIRNNSSRRLLFNGFIRSLKQAIQSRRTLKYSKLRYIFPTIGSNFRLWRCRIQSWNSNCPRVLVQFLWLRQDW